jgi:predicted enzyme related to lactoylglutathione lyase
MSHHETVTTDQVEYASRDPAATRHFLERVLGFPFDILEQMDGYGIRSDKVLRGSGTGVRALVKGESPATISYLTVVDIEASLKLAQQEGARVIMPKTEIPGMGWHAVVHAPGDVPIGLFQGKPGAPGM